MINDGNSHLIPRLTMAPDPGKKALDLTRVALIALMFGFSMVSYFERTIISIAGPELMKAFNLSPTQMGSIYSAFILGYALLMIPGGYVTDRLGGRLTLALMGGLSAVFTALIVLSGRPGLGRRRRRQALPSPGHEVVEFSFCRLRGGPKPRSPPRPR